MKTKRTVKSKPVVNTGSESTENSTMRTDIKYIQKLVKLLETSNLTEIEIEEQGTKLRVAKSSNIMQPALQYAMQAPAFQAAPAQTQTAPIAESKSEEKKEETTAPGKQLIEVKSPIVGTFYRAPSPTADPYVQVGTVVSKGTVLCIIEAMKLMNEIESDYEGKIVKIMVENGKPVEYNQTLFLIEPV